MATNGAFAILAKEADHGRRLDAVVAANIFGCSRSQAVYLISHQAILVDDQPKKPGYRVKFGDTIRGEIPAPTQTENKPEPIPLHILYEDRHLVVLNKQAGLVVHPAPGHGSGTLVNALLHHCPDLEAINGEIRPGIVHRLDKDTSGTMVVAKNATTHESLARQFKNRTVQKKYLALVYGELQSDEGSVKLPIGRHPVHRKRMSTIASKGRNAETIWRVRERFAGITLLELDLKTGRTHQIRVHCSTMGHPIVGDPVYGPRKLFANLKNLRPNLSPEILTTLKLVSRQMLHAWKLGFTHPAEKKFLIFESSLPADMARVIDCLKHAKL